MEEKRAYHPATDEQFQKPYVDKDEWRETPVRHRYVHGGFEGTETRFCFYYPPKENYEGRFFQHLAPVQCAETELQEQQPGEDDFISFCLTHGAYLVETNLGGLINGGGDNSLLYRCSAAAAEYSRKLATEFYGCARPFGYVTGGSGGGYKTMSCMESTEGVWDGAVPFVIGSPVALPNVFTVRAHAMRLLRHKFDQIVDALEPGGSGDPYACLNDEEAAALREATLMGFPMETWCVHETLGEGALPVLYPAVPMIDPTYFEDFWTKPGYLGYEENGSARRDRIRLETEIVRIYHPELGLQGQAETIDEGNAYGVDEAWKHQFGKQGVLPVLELKDMPKGDFYTRGLTMKFLDGPLAGETIKLIIVAENAVTGEADTSGRDLAEMMQKIRPGDRVLLDNSDYIAVQTLHRHQVPGSEFHAWDQFRDEKGEAIYPQRPMLIGPIIAMNGAGSIQTGTVHGKMIVVESLMDESAFPWQADWYRHLVERVTGTKADEQIRLYYMEHCMHTDCSEGNGGDHQHIVSYVGALHQALLDLSHWVEKGVEPPASSAYEMDGGQVRIPATARERLGLQPVVHLLANGELHAKVKAGQSVQLVASVEIPVQAGALEEVLWAFEGRGEFRAAGTVSGTEWQPDGTGKAGAGASYTFSKPGVYFPIVKVATNHRAGDEYTRVRNLARVRVTVE